MTGDVPHLDTVPKNWRPEEAPISSLTYHVEQWSDDDKRVVAILAASMNVRIARAAYEVALTERPTSIVRLRQKAFVLEERIPEGMGRK